MTAIKSAATSAVMTASGANVSGGQANLKKGANHHTTKTTKPRTKPTHPRTAEMVNAAIKTLKERSGSSLQAIKKYISATYKIDVEKQAPFIKKYLKTAVTNGSLVQSKGKGAAGSFKLSTGKTVASNVQKKAPTKATPLKKAVAVVKKPAVKRSVKKVATKKSPVKVSTTEKRKTIKGPAAKPPKVKSSGKVKVVPKSAPKRKLTMKKSTLMTKTKTKAVKRVVTKKK